ncbi:hypothetical protein TPAR_08275 [Tolypocladium paradoxum]|uniref:Uncharacterized protein n=1 Tax=Tolypocladium paradoxum TaxID=94208 RepID=A0A2S4KMY2_9HYPO|nr:hypothetical protein TPAR_08275 [Tolypocladium paradoxum]
MVRGDRTRSRGHAIDQYLRTMHKFSDAYLYDLRSRMRDKVCGALRRQVSDHEPIAAIRPIWPWPNAHANLPKSEESMTYKKFWLDREEELRGKVRLFHLVECERHAVRAQVLHLLQRNPEPETRRNALDAWVFRANVVMDGSLVAPSDRISIVQSVWAHQADSSHRDELDTWLKRVQQAVLLFGSTSPDD